MDVSKGVDARSTLDKNDKIRLWARCLLLAVVFSFACGVGLYSLAPDGHYQIGPGTPSHDPHKYLWFFQPNGIGVVLLLIEGLFFGALMSLTFVVPIACIVGVLLSLVRPLAPIVRRFLSTRGFSLIIIAVLVGWILGVAVTVTSGVFPGLCC